MKPKPKSEDSWEGAPFVPDIRVFEPENTEIDTGLVDTAGTKIIRRTPRGTIGFDLTGKK